ncbi:MAG TPA: thiol:disulfide interchange protein [Oxalobacteraceae bacterium]|nr:thiol:disulfide interchange protein [Oxalobacteraceae bacterium]
MRLTIAIRHIVAVVLVAGLLPLVYPVQAAGGSSFATTQSAAAETGAFSSLKRFFGGADSQPELLPPEQAFTAKVRVKDATTLVAEFEPANGYYLYRDRISFSVVQPAAAQIENVRLPDGEMKSDPTFGHVAVFHAPFAATIGLKRTAGTASTIRLQASYQGCSDLGVCYPPIEKTIEVDLPALAAAAVVAADSPLTMQGDQAAWGPAKPAADTGAAAAGSGWWNLDRSATLFQSHTFGWVIAGFFGFGLLLSLTPCVWPMIPILSGIIAGQGATLSRSRALGLSAAYVLGMALTYAGAGIAAGLSGSLLSSALQTPWVLAGMAVLFVILALSMFGLYELQMPAFLQTRIASVSGKSSKRTVASVFAMGAVSAVIVGPCIAAPLAAALLYIGQTQDVVLGGAALFAMALGKGVPLLVIGTSLGSLLPRSGTWMQSIKMFLGVLLLAAALWTVSPFIPVAISMTLAGALLIGYAVYLRALDALPVDATGYARFGKGLGVIGLLIGAIYLLGAFSGSRNFLQPLASLSTSSESKIQAPLPFERVGSVEELDARLSNTGGSYVMLDFYADWCVSCKEMEHFTFSDPSVRAKLQGVVLLQADVTANSALHKQLLARFGLFGPPAILFFNPSGQEVKGHRVIGFMEENRFGNLLDQILLKRKEIRNG